MLQLNLCRNSILSNKHDKYEMLTIKDFPANTF